MEEEQTTTEIKESFFERHAGAMFWALIIGSTALSVGITVVNYKTARLQYYTALAKLAEKRM